MINEILGFLALLGIFVVYYSLMAFSILLCFQIIAYYMELRIRYKLLWILALMLLYMVYIFFISSSCGFGCNMVYYWLVRNIYPIEVPRPYSYYIGIYDNYDL